MFGFRIGEEVEGAVLVAEPDFFGTGLEVELALFAHLTGGVGGRKDFDADLRGDFEGDLTFDPGEALVGIPADVGGADAIDGGDRAFRQGKAAEQVVKLDQDLVCLVAVRATGWRGHEKGSVGVGLDSVWQIGEGGIVQDLLPPPSVESDHLVSRGKINEEFHW